MLAIEFAVIESKLKTSKRKIMDSHGSFTSGSGDEDPDLSEVCLVGGDLVEFNTKRIGPGLRKLDLSFNIIQRMKGLELSADTLEEIIVDNNQLRRIELRANFPKLHTLSLNKNMVSDLAYLVSTLKRFTPCLRYLSLLGNPGCPDQLSADDVDESDYQLYRFYIVHHLPALRFLDHKPITQLELFESRSSHHAEISLYQQSSPLPSQQKSYQQKSVAFSKTGGVEIRNTDAPPSKGKQGKRRFKYIGKNSEGNRFIQDTDL